MGEFVSNMAYAKAIGEDVSRPHVDRRHTSQRVTDEMNEMRQRISQLESDLLILVGRLYGEDDSTFAPETYDVMQRWRPIFKRVHNLKV